MSQEEYTNELIKKRYFSYLEEEEYAHSFISAHENAILLWQEFTNQEDFGKFNQTKAREFKEWLKTKPSKGKAKILSLSYCYHILQRLKKFFDWLSRQPSYKSRINKYDIQFLDLSKEEYALYAGVVKETRAALATKRNKIPTMITETLHKIQTSLVAPKNQFNSFGKYKYRSCEDILEGLKKVLKDHKAAVLLEDEIVDVGGRIYVKATATLRAGDESISASAYAREELEKKGMSESQITGSASSYARKYALNGLFAIDDTKDADTGTTDAMSDKDLVMAKLVDMGVEQTGMKDYLEKNYPVYYKAQQWKELLTKLSS